MAKTELIEMFVKFIAEQGGDIEIVEGSVEGNDFCIVFRANGEMWQLDGDRYLPEEALH